MRLVCPNCEAKYEVPEDAIPETGRDVQCANCGHAWYQMRARSAVAETVPAAAEVAATPVPGQMPAPEMSPEPEVASAPEPAPETAPDPVPGPETSPEPAAEPEAAGSPDLEPVVADAVVALGEGLETGVEDAAAFVADAAGAVETAATEAGLLRAATDALVEEAKALVAGSDPEPEIVTPVIATPVIATPEVTAAPDTVDVAAAASLAAAGAAVAPAAYAVDDSVLAILREEAEREASARRAEADRPLEVQADLGIDAAIPAAARTVGAATLPPSGLINETADDRLSARRTRLPDVEEINSTLRPSEQAVETGEAMAVPAEGRSSFRKGFLMVMTFAILGAALYVSADALSNAVPALTGFLDAYVGFIDSLRLHLDGLMQSATVAINGV